MGLEFMIKTGRTKDAEGHKIYTIDVTLPDGTVKQAGYYDLLDYWEDLSILNRGELPEDF